MAKEENGTKRSEINLTETERRHYEPQFSAIDPKWTCWPEKRHVQKAAFHVSVLSALLAVLLLLLALLLLRPLPLRLFFLCFCVLLCAISALAFIANLRQNDVLFLPYIFFLWFLSIFSFALFFFLLPMIVVPEFWREWVLYGFGVDSQGFSVFAIRLITILGAIIAFVLLCLFTLFNFTILRARNFVIGKRAAKRKGHGGEMGQIGEKKERRKEDSRKVRVVETIA